MGQPVAGRPAARRAVVSRALRVQPGGLLVHEAAPIRRGDRLRALIVNTARSGDLLHQGRIDL
jgi:hypothetical protein